MRSFRAFSATLAGVSAAILGVACSDVATAPVEPVARIAPSPIGQFDRGGNGPGGGSVDYNATVTFTVKPGDDTYLQIGPHFLYIPENSVCDPATSGYGIDTWTLPCKTITKPLTITATASLYNGHPIVEFNVHLRFKPGNDSRFDVMLYLRDDKANTRSRIYWCPDAVPGKPAPVCVDETQTTLSPGRIQSRFDPRGGFIYRRIEHFSGYNVTAGDTGDGTGIGGGQ